MSQLSGEQSLTMFFDNEFNPSTYVDALFQSIITKSNPELNLNHSNPTPATSYNKKTLNLLSNNLSDITTHLDYYTNELSTELSTQINTLKQTSSSILSNLTNNDNITRLQYYITSLNHSIVSLNSEIESVKSKNSTNEINNKSIKNLIDLKLVRSNLLKVLTNIEKLNLIINSKDGSSINLQEFQESIDLLYETLKQSFTKELSNDEKQDLVDNCNDLIDLLPLFKNLNNFYPVYKKFTSALSEDLNKLGK